MTRSEQARAIAMRQKGKTYGQIGERFGVSATTARRWVSGAEKPSVVNVTVHNHSGAAAIEPGFISGAIAAGVHHTLMREKHHKTAPPPSESSAVTSVAGRPQAHKRVGFLERFLRVIGFYP